jgi:formate dehydrogenase subunit gamma
MYAWHLASAGVLVGGVTLIVLAGNRRALRATARELGSLDVEDREWLGAIPARLLSGAPEPPAGRFNAGQKLNFALVCLLVCILYITGVDTIVAGTHHNLIFGGHKLATIALCVLVAGHLYMALANRATRPALRGMLTGEVNREWARKHYPRWKP